MIFFTETACGQKRKSKQSKSPPALKKPCVIAPIRLTDSVTGKEFVSELSDAWKMELKFAKNEIELMSSPFQVGRISAALADSVPVIDGLLHEMTDSVTWTRRQTDFLELNQTCDLISLDVPHLKAFYQFLNTDLIEWMRQVTGFDLTHVSANCSMYNHGDHLLVHDDCISDRKIAFVFYISPWPGTETWTEQMGGALDLFDHNKGDGQPRFPSSKRIAPQNNQLVFFRVCEKSYHQVGEVLSLDYPRLTINGWFHGPGEEFTAQVRPSPLASQLSSPIGEHFNLSEWLNESYLQDSIKGSIQEEIENESQISLRDFLIDDFIQVVLGELKSNSVLSWTRPYSACERNYECLNLSGVERGPIADLSKLFQSTEFLKLLHEYTDLDLSGAHAKTPTCHVELQRWTNECYTMLTNESNESSIGNILDVILYLNEDKHECGVGTYVYVHDSQTDGDGGSHEDDNEEPDDVLLTVEPQANSLNIVYCNAGVSRFGKFVSKSVKMENDFVYILCCSYKE